MRTLSLAYCFVIVGGASALANVPVDDAAQLMQKTETKSHTNDMVPVQQDQNKGQKGINCATHTGQKGTARDTTAEKNDSAGVEAVKKYDPQMPATPAADAKGPALSYQTIQKSAGNVVAGNIATQTTITTSTPVYQQASSSAGQAATIMAGYDQNSSGGAQNGMSWNQVTSSANLWIEAFNAMNLSEAAATSQAAQAMRFVPWTPGIAPLTSVCGAGYRGAGTASDPCIATTSAFCQALSDGGCWERRYVDATGNVVVYLESASAQAQAAPTQ